ncbi:MAG: pyridoxamine 5'-phosphate oxidase family protein [Chloroflexota bacterium]
MTNTIDATRRRPYMPNYGIATDEAGLMSWAWVDEQMAKSRNYWIASTRPDGRPHVAPVWGVWYEGALCFGSDPQSRKARNFAHQPEIVVHLESGDDTVILEGSVTQLRDPALIAPVDVLYAAKYPPFDPTPSTMYFVLRPHTALAWQEHDFPNTATRWDLE